MRKLYTSTIGIFLTFLFISCTQFTADIEDYLSYWSTEVASTNFTIDTPYTRVGEMPYVSSAEDVIVTIKLRNPKKLTLKMPTFSDNVIRFPGLSTQPQYGTAKDYTLTQTTSNKLTLTYKKDFLQAHEWGSGDIGAEITFIADDNRVFDKRFSMNFKVNTPPPKPDFIVAKTTGTPSYYVLCITVPKTDMQETIAGGLLHKDIKRIDINGTPYSFSVNETEKKFVKPEADAFITLSDVTKLSEPDADEVPTDGWVLYYKTDAEVKDGAAKKDYTITLADEKGLVSAALNASTKPNRPAPVHISLVKGICTADVNNDNTETTPHTIAVGGQNKPATLRLTSATANATIYYTLTETSAGSTASLSNGSGAGSGFDISLPIQTGKTEAKYTLTAWAEADGFETGTTRTVYYKIIAQSTDTALNELKLTEGTVNYSASLIAGSDSAYICKILFTGVARTLNLTAKTANDQSKITAVTVNGTIPAGFVAANTVTLVNAVTLPDSLPAQAVVKITVTGEDTSATKEYTLTVTAIDPPVLNSLAFSSGGTPVQFSNAADTGNEAFSANTLEYYIFAAQLSPSSLSFTATPEADAAVTVKVNGSDHTGTTVLLPTVGGETLVTFTVEKAGLQNEYKVHIKRKSYTVTLTAKSSDDESAAGGGTINVTNAVGTGGISSVSSNNSAEVTVKAEIGATITATATPNTGYTFMKWSGISVTSPTNVNLSYVVGSNAEIKAEFKSPNIYVRGTNGDWYSNTTNVPGGAAEGNDDTGTGSKQKPYKTVSKALSQCTETGTPYTIFVDGTINETVTLNIPSGKTVTIESLRKDTPAVIEEKRVSPSAYQYLIKTAGTLTLDSVILKANKTGTHTPDANTFICGIQQNGGTVTVKGNTTEIRNFAHAVEVKGGTFTMEGGSICNNYINGGSAGVTIEGGGTFKLTGGSIKNNEATSMAGVYVKGSSATNQGIFKMESGEISGNKAKCLGGGIYVGEYGVADISGGTITANHAAQITYKSPAQDVGGGGIYIEKGTVNFTGGTIKGNIIHEVEKNCGAGVFIGEKGTFNMSGGSIKDCTTQTSASRPSRGVGVYVSGGSMPNTEGTFKMTGGTIENCKPLAGHTGAGGAVYVGQYGKFSMSGNVNISTNETDTGKNDIYLATGTKITIAGKLDRNYHVARITPESYPASSSSNTQVLENPTGNTTNVAENHFKFTVTRDSNTNKAYCVNEAGLIRQQVDTTLTNALQNWGKLKNAIETASNNDVIYLRDNCTASNATDTITVTKKITLIGVTGSHIDLSADGKCRIFTIQNDGDLTIKNLSLKDGFSADGKGGSGILLENTSSNNKSLTLENTEITGCVIRSGTVSHGAGIAIHKGTVTMKDKAAIKSCENQHAGGFGGGVYIGSGGTLNINGSLVDNPVGSTDISSCKAEKGGGVYIANGGKLNLIKGRILGNRATGSTGEGYAVYNENGSANTFNWSGGKIMSHSAYGSATVIKGPCNNTSGNTAD
jgi:putative lipoprotein